MKSKIIASLIVIVTLCSCQGKESSEKNTDSQKQETTVPDDSSKKEKTEPNKEKGSDVEVFSWDDIVINTNDIGSFPFFTPPKGIVIDENSSNTYLKDVFKLRMFYKTSNSLFDIEGKVQSTHFKMEDPNKKWDLYYFQKSVIEYLTSIGATQIHTGKITREYHKKYWNNYDDKFTVPYRNVKDIRMWVIKTADRKIGVQLGEKTIAIVEEKDFKQTIKKITASDILEEINAKGFATVQINFDTNKSRIQSASYALITEISKMMEASTNLKLSIEGHTDNVGDAGSNLKLSKNRAKSVFIALIDEGVDESRLKSEGFGQTKPIADNTTDEGKALNRRVELRKI